MYSRQNVECAIKALIHVQIVTYSRVEPHQTHACTSLSLIRSSNDIQNGKIRVIVSASGSNSRRPRATDIVRCHRRGGEIWKLGSVSTNNKRKSSRQRIVETGIVEQHTQPEAFRRRPSVRRS